MEIILASTSPRRAELLRQMGIRFRVQPSLVEEGQPYEPWHEWVMDLAKAKALAVAGEKGKLVLAADTIVVLGNRVLGKPRDSEEACRMLRMLSGKNHEVMTGVCLISHENQEPRILQDVGVTKVKFRELCAEEITNYASTGEPLDKAGAYGIQGLGALLVEEVQGCYFNVVGLPLMKTMQLLRKCNVPVLGVPRI